jgi:hypothetical protein
MQFATHLLHHLTHLFSLLISFMRELHVPTLPLQQNQKQAALQLRLLLHSPHLKPLTVLLQHALIMVFPELLRGVLARDSF